MRAVLALALAVSCPLTACTQGADVVVGEDPAGAAEQAVQTKPTAQLAFQADWTIAQRGAVVRGGHVDVTHANSRLVRCPAPTVMSFARFQPGGQLFSSDEAFGFDVPSDATSVELWFHAIAPGCEEWDSNFGANWHFPVIAHAPANVGWAGDWGSSTDRACAHGAGVVEPITIDEYMRERACIFVDVDVWVPGVTDVVPAHPEWLQAQVEWKKDQTAPTQEWLSLVELVGHNARFRWVVPDAIRNHGDWAKVSYTFSLDSDGTHTLRVGQANGAARTLVRAFTLP